MREREIEEYLIDAVEALGGEVRKVKWVGRRGAPDRLVLLPGRHFLVELKRPGKTFEPHQLREALRLQVARFDVMLFDTKERIDEFFDNNGSANAISKR